MHVMKSNVSGASQGPLSSAVNEFSNSGIYRSAKETNKSAATHRDQFKDSKISGSLKHQNSLATVKE